MTDEIKQVIKAAIAGEGPTKEEARVAGRMLFTYGWRLSSLAFAVWSVGGFNSFGLGGGFAYADNQKSKQILFEERLKSIERRLLEQDIMATHKESCEQPRKQYFRDRLNDLQSDYNGKVGGRLPLPSCQDLGL